MLNNFIEIIDNGWVKKSVREYDAIVYDFLERNKDRLCDVYNIPPYNPTELKKEFITWIKKNKCERLVEPIHKRPVHISLFLGDKQFK